MIQTYDPSNKKLSVLGIPIIGFADGTFCKVERNEDSFSLKVGADGETVRTRSRNRSGKLTITLLASSPSNDALSAKAQQDEDFGTGVGSVLLQDLDGNTLVQANNAWVSKIAALEWAKEAGEREWVIEMDYVNIFVGGIDLVAATE